MANPDDRPIDPWLAEALGRNQKASEEFAKYAKLLREAIEEFLKAVKDINKPGNQEGQQENGKE